MKKLFAMLLLSAAIVLASCSKDDPTPDLVSVAFSALTANGSATESSTTLTLTFDKAIEGLVVADITLTAGETGAVKGALTAKGSGVYELAVSDIVKGGEVTVAVAKTGYTITPASKTVTVYVALVAVGNFYYEDNTFSTTLDADKTCIGIVFVVNADGKSGKIVGLQEGVEDGSEDGVAWGGERNDSAIPAIGQSIRSTTDGATATKNLITALKDERYFTGGYPAFNWIYTTINGGNLDGRWYIPAKEELLALYAAWNGDATTTANTEARAAFNAQLTAASGSVLSEDRYWSSTEADARTSFRVDFNNGDSSATNKIGSAYVCAISTFATL